MRIEVCTWLAALAACVALGCAPAAKDGPAAGTADVHPAHGPHGGDLIELGAEEYHAELVHDEKSGAITIYLLDELAAKPVAIEATEIVININHDGTPEQHKLAAAPQSEDPMGKSSRFTATGNEELAKDLDAEGVDARLQVTINGTGYTGKIVHSHGDHDHAHADGTSAEHAH